MRLILCVFSCVFFACLVSACIPSEPIENAQSYVFGTLVDITVYGEPEGQAQEISGQIIRDFQELHNRLHAWRPSEIKTLNNAFERENLPLTTKPDIALMIADATALSIQSKGAFNPAIGGLINAWGFQSDEFKPVKMNDAIIQNWLKHNPQMVDIVVENGKVFSRNKYVKLDLGGYAKGYALDMAIKKLRQNGVKNALVNIGGNIIALGTHGDKPWRVGIQHPRKPSAIATIDLESGWAVGTSGDYQRYFELNGQRYCHIINPATGYPAQGVQAVTVLIPPQLNAGVLSDVASKPIFIAKPDARQQAAKDMGIDNYLVIDAAGEIAISPAMAKRVTWVEPSTAKHVTEIQP